MKCPFCNTPLPVDGNTPQVTCPKCGSEFNIKIRPVQGLFSMGEELYPEPIEHPSYGEDKRYDSPTNY